MPDIHNLTYAAIIAILEFSEKVAYVSVGDVCRGQLGMQCQYGSRYLNDTISLPGYPFLGEGLRVRGTHVNYHTLEIHKDDVDEFVRRVKEYRNR